MTQEEYTGLIKKFISRQITAEEFTKTFHGYYLSDNQTGRTDALLQWLNEKISLSDEENIRVSAAKTLRELTYSAP